MSVGSEARPLRFATVADLRQSGDPSARRLSRALDASPGEPFRTDLERIKAVRQRMLADETRIEILNFGAGSRNSSRRPTHERSTAGYTTYSSVAEVCHRAASKPRKGLTLYSLVREFAPGRSLELGTCIGLSSAYLATAMRHNGHGRLVTLEGAPSFAEIARRTFRELGLEVEVEVGRFVDTLPRVLLDGPFDFAFVDGHHDEDATVAYHEQLLPHLAERSVLVFDDIAWSPGMASAWNRVSSHASTTHSVSLGAMGVCLVRGQG